MFELFVRSRAFIRSNIFASKSAVEMRGTQKPKFMPSPLGVCVWLISLAKFQCVNGGKFIDLLFTKNKKQNTPTREPYLKSCKILPRWTIYFSLHPFHLVAREKKNIPKRNEFIYLLKCHFLAMSRCFHTQVFYLCFAIIELPSKRRKKAKKHIVYIYSE